MAPPNEPQDAPAPPPSPPSAPKGRTASKAGDDSIKETLESIVIAFILAFVFRAYIVEAFVIPTGSMAPTLLGAHLDLRSPTSGYRYDLNAMSHRNVALPALPRPVDAHDPMTMLRQRLDAGTRTSAGDRILVQKYLYFLSQPRRWDVVVFKAPHVPEMNYIKRLVGKPHEDLYLLDGNVYVRPRGASWRIARKTDRPEVQRAVWQPIYRSAYVPLPTLASPIGEDAWAVPWRAERNADWDLESRDAYTYRGSKPAALRFDFNAGPYHGGAAMYPYNQFLLASHGLLERQIHPIEDIRLAATIEPRGDRPPTVALETTGRWEQASHEHPVQRLRAVIESTGHARLEVVPHADASPQTLAEARTKPLQPGDPRRLELWFVDQHLLLWNDGEIVCEARLDLPIDRLRSRPPPAPLPEPAIRLDGPATLTAVHLDRDLHYRAGSPIGGGQRALAGLVRRPDGRILDANPVRLGHDEFFCLGDNSPASGDSRYWGDPNAWVASDYFADPNRARPGVVPRELLIGRAFFVYFPAPHKLLNDKTGIVPNFGRMRFIH